RDRDDVAAAAQRVDRTPVACLTRDFEEFLHSERGLSRSTAVSYLPVVRSFLAKRFGRKALRLEQLRAQDLHGFILREVQRVSRSHGKGTVTALRSFLRFRPQAAEALLRGQQPGIEVWDAAAAAVVSVLDEPLSDIHGSADYRRHLAGVLTKQALAAAAERAGRNR
ncbi:MAG TPA: site-specific integrase, partial [Ktedonobacteraceae bacterium]